MHSVHANGWASVYWTSGLDPTFVPRLNVMVVKRTTVLGQHHVLRRFHDTVIVLCLFPELNRSGLVGGDDQALNRAPIKENPSSEVARDLKSDHSG